MNNSKKISIFYHVATMNNYQEVFDDFIKHVKNSGLYNKIQKIYLCIVGSNDLINVPKKCEIIYKSKNIEEYEFPTIQKLWDYCKNTKEEEYILYCHTKGVSVKNYPKERAFLWKDMMTHFCVDEYEQCIMKLNNNCDLCGCGFVNNPLSHYNGNFWWAKSSYIKKLKQIKKSENRFDCEMWVGMQNPNYSDLFPYKDGFHLPESQQNYIQYKQNYEKRKLKEIKLNIFYHIATIKNYQEVFNEFILNLKVSGLYYEIEKIFLCIVGKGKLFNIPSKCEIIYRNDDLQQYEFPIIQKIWKYCQDLKSEEYILYCHTKGVSRDDNHIGGLAHLWRQVMSYFCIERYEDCINFLNHNGDTCGSGIEFNYYKGNFWWAKSSYIKTKSFLEKSNNRFECEGWIGSEKANMGDLFPYGNLFNYDYVKNKFLEYKIELIRKKINIFCNIETVENFQEEFNDFIIHIKKNGLYKEVNNIYINITGNKKLLEIPKKCNVTYNNELQHFQFQTFQKIWEYCREIQSEEYILYYNIKEINEYCYFLKKAIKHFHIERYKDCIDFLNQGSDICGTYLQKKNLNESNFNGDFWWAKASHIKRLPFLSSTDNRDYCKTWISRNYPKIKKLFTLQKDFSTNESEKREYLEYKKNYDIGKQNKMKDKHRGERCFIIGSGPSIDNYDLSFLKDEITICVNKSFKIIQKYGFDPTYSCMTDIKAYRSYGCDEYEKLNSGIVFGKQFEEEKEKKYKGDNIVFLADCPGEEAVYDGFFTHDMRRGAYQKSYTVIIGSALPFAMFLGCKEIYLLGCDTNLNGYSEKIEGSGENKLNIDLVMKSYQVVKDYTIKEYRKASIFVVGKESSIDIFPRVELEPLKKASKKSNSRETSKYRNFILDHIHKETNKNIIDLEIADLGQEQDPIIIDCDILRDNVKDLTIISKIEDSKYDIIYSSHFILEFTDEELTNVLKELIKKLKNNNSMVIFLVPDRKRYIDHCKRKNADINQAHQIDDFGPGYIVKKLSECGYIDIYYKHFWDNDIQEYNFMVSAKPFKIQEGIIELF